MRPLVIFTVCTVISASAFVGVAAFGGHSGFPLDDGWIHQTYARNWAETGQLAYVAGQPSAGSTAPLWTWLLSLAYRLQIDPVVWAYTLGTLSLAVSAWLVYRLADRLYPAHRGVAWAAGLACALEWHLVWAAASGMETTLFIALTLLVAERTLAGSRAWLIGAIGGALILTRPEGLLLMGLVAAALGVRSDWRALLQFSIGFLIVLAPGAVFNLQAGGTLFPNTFFAKQSEYAILTSNVSIWLQAIAELIAAPLSGAMAAALPGCVVWLIAQRRRLLDRKRWAEWLLIVWAGAHLGVYALRLPVHYQHGRYLIPIIPVVVLYGVIGTAQLANRAGRWARVIGRVLALSIAAITIGFLPIGAVAYATDVSIIDGEMVTVARWIDAHVPANAVVAAHDIGALGYFTRRPLLDLAGLISPEVIPFIRDETRLLQWVQAKGAQYVVTFPSWYPTLVNAANLSPGFAGRSNASPDHLTVYAVK